MLNSYDHITAEEARSVLGYDPVTGLLTWLVDRGKNKNKGKTAGAVNKISGYVIIGLFGKRLLAHRLIVLIVTGSWPDREVDHRDLNRSNNTWENLRHAGRKDNCGNAPCHKDNKSGVKGVSWNSERRKWAAQICIDGKQTNLGRYDSIQEAHAAYCKAASAQFGEFARFG